MANKESVSPAAADLYPKFALVSSGDTLQRRLDEPSEIQALRKKAQQQADSMRNLVAVQSFAWGSGNKAPSAFADLVFGSHSKIASASCYGKVWTDADLNILRASLRLELPGQWRDCRSVVTYGWLKPAEEAPRLIPLTISTQVEFKMKISWCRGLFTNYHVFTSRAKIVASGNVQGLPR